MTELNNLDVIILIIIGISALIAYSRGLMKEVMSIVGWVLGCIVVIYLLPIINPFTMNYVKNGTFAGILTAVVILIAFLVCWVLFTAKVVGKVRTSKLSSLDRMLGLFFGIARACLLIILCYILIGWIVPADKQSPILQESKYYTLAGTFAEPIEKLIPKDTLDTIKEKTSEVGLTSDEDEEEKKSEAKDKKETNKDKNDVDALFEKLAQPQIEKMRDDKKKLQQIKEDFEGYNNYERNNLDRLIENTVE